MKTTKEERRELREKVVLVMLDEGDPVGDWQKVLDVIDDLDGLHSAASAMLKAVELAHDCEDIHFCNRPETRKPGGGVDCEIITDMRVALDGSTTGQITGPSGAEGPKDAAAFSTPPNASEPGASDDARIRKSRSPEIEASANVEPAGGEDGAGVCSRCEGLGATPDDALTPWKTNPCSRCEGTGKEPAP